MTKNVRIENADTASYVVVVEVWQTVEGTPVLQETRRLAHPAELLTIAIWKDRYLVVREE